MVVRRARTGKTDVLLDAMPQLMSHEIRPAIFILGQWKDDHRPLHASPVDSRICNVYFCRQFPNENIPAPGQEAFRICLIGDCRASFPVNEEHRTAKRNAPKFAVVPAA